MNGPEHYAQAERLLALAMLDENSVEDGYLGEIAAAQVHATLALAAATAQPSAARWIGDTIVDDRDWSRVTAPAKTQA